MGNLQYISVLLPVSSSVAYHNTKVRTILNEYCTQLVRNSILLKCIHNLKTLLYWRQQFYTKQLPKDPNETADNMQLISLLSIDRKLPIFFHSGENLRRHIPVSQVKHTAMLLCYTVTFSGGEERQIQHNNHLISFMGLFIPLR